MKVIITCACGEDWQSWRCPFPGVDGCGGAGGGVGGDEGEGGAGIDAFLGFFPVPTLMIHIPKQALIMMPYLWSCC